MVSAKAASGWACLGVVGTQVTEPLGQGSSVAVVLCLRGGKGKAKAECSPTLVGAA